MKSTTKRSMTDRFVDGCYRWMPNSIVLVFLLTVLVAVLAVIFCGSPLVTSTETAGFGLCCPLLCRCRWLC